MYTVFRAVLCNYRVYTVRARKRGFTYLDFEHGPEEGVSERGGFD
jgi:hypothetical protein